MFTISLLQRLKLRHKVAALGVVGMAACLLALFQVLRWQGLELQQTQASQEALAPALLAVDLQRGVVDHRAAAARLLGGERAAETQRREHQSAVDARLAMLDHRLQFTERLPARQELHAMRADWLKLVQQVVTSSCSVAQSNSAHRLLVEQALQIIDVLSIGHADAAPLRQALDVARSAARTEAAGLAQTARALGGAQARLQQAQSQRVAMHRAHQAMAASGMLALAAAMVGLVAWLSAALRQAGRQAAPPPLPGPAGWKPPRADGRSAGNLAGRALIARLKGTPPPASPRLDQPTAPQEL